MVEVHLVEAVNMALARVLAQKEHYLKSLRKAHGKLIVADELLLKAQRAQKRARSDAALERAIDMSVLGCLDQ